MKNLELRDLSHSELATRVEAMEKDLFKLKFKHRIRQLENTSALMMLKKNIARVKTVINQKIVND